jgi:hypothetical protein
LVTNGEILSFVAKIVPSSVALGVPLYCIELGVRQAKNLCRMTTSIIAPAKSAADAIRYMEQHFPDALAHADVQRVFEARHVIINWPQGMVDIVGKDESNTIFPSL